MNFPIICTILIIHMSQMKKAVSLHRCRNWGSGEGGGGGGGACVGAKSTSGSHAHKKCVHQPHCNHFHTIISPYYNYVS